MNLLHISTSLFSEQGHSHRLAEAGLRQLRQRRPGLTLRTRDLARDPLPHLDADALAALGTDPEQRSPQQAARVAALDGAIADLQWADLLVLGAPMYNFSIPSQLKAWFDAVARAGVTFRYTAQGPEGLLKGKRALVISSRGGRHRDTAQDHAAPLVNTLLNFIGIEAIDWVFAEGLAMGDDARDQGLEAAHGELTAALDAILAALPEPRAGTPSPNSTAGQSTGNHRQEVTAS